MGRFHPAAPPRPERCELCGHEIDQRHRHVADIEAHVLACACRDCALPFEKRAAARGRFKTVPQRYLVDRDHVLDRSAWESLGIPGDTVFLVRNAAPSRCVALHPSPTGGATESELDPRTWHAALSETPLAQELRPDVEALLVRHIDGRSECYLVPIDICYESVGRMRRHWQGFHGDTAARIDPSTVFDLARTRAQALRSATAGA
nr:DUF5947 family protein [Streptomyces sp. SID3343]